MALDNITDYCSAAQEAAGTCETSLGIARGFRHLIEATQDNLLFVVIALIVLGFFIWLASKVGKV